MAVSVKSELKFLNKVEERRTAVVFFSVFPHVAKKWHDLCVKPFFQFAAVSLKCHVYK